MDHMIYEITIHGIVQGVGFRPFIHNLADSLDIKGQVYNTTEGVTILADFVDASILDLFINKIKEDRPKASFIEEIKFKKTGYLKFDDFRIVESKRSDETFQLISPDIATCSACLEDICKDYQRRHDYAFTNCTNCGPRFTIINNMPYDRPNTTMSSFKMCRYCLSEYNDSKDRRFHAQPNACSVCGPRLMLLDKDNNTLDCKNPLLECAGLLKDGKIVAIKSLGGFQIAVNATDDDAVRTLRERKKRPFKPFALMIKDISSAKRLFKISKTQQESILSSRAPIVLLDKKQKGYISELVSGYSDCEGVMMPYTPLHHILFKYIDFPLVMTSANIAEEPIVSEHEEAFKKLKGICDYFLVHDRKISSKYDDSLLMIFDDKEMLLRRARGYAPYPLKLKDKLTNKVVFGAGANEKNTFCFLMQKYAIVSQHIGDLENYDTAAFYKVTMDKYIDIFNIPDIDCIVHDIHPDYYSTKFAKGMDSKIKIELSHHKAHILSVIAENALDCDLIGFSWDGTGLGEDGKIWGSEVFLVNKDLGFTRAAHLSEFLMPGGTVSIQRPYRMALSLLYDQYIKRIGSKTNSFSSFVYESFPFFTKVVTEKEIELILKQLQTGFNTPATTSMGRLFDSVSSLLDLTHIASYEGEAAVHLQMHASADYLKSYNIKTLIKDSEIVIDVNDLVGKIIYDLIKGIDSVLISAKFHNTVSELIYHLSKIFRDNYNICNVALSGGVFQNRIILEKSFALLREGGFNVYSNFRVPVNDGGISLGQAYYGLKFLEKY